MIQPSFILFPDKSTWRIASVNGADVSFTNVSLPVDATASQAAPVIADSLNRAGYSGEGTALAVPSSWCYSASISIADLPRNDRKAMLYRLEEKLPLAVETLIADFILHHSPTNPGAFDTALGLCMKTALLQDWVNALGKVGVSVQTISPAVLLAGQQLLSQSASGTSDARPSAAPAIFLLGQRESASTVNLLAFEDATLVRWTQCPPKNSDLKLQLSLLVLDMHGSPTIHAVNGDPGFVTGFSAGPYQIAPRQGDVPTLAALCAAEVCGGRRRPWVEFRRDALAVDDALSLYRKPLNLVLAAALAFLALGTIGMLIRAQRYDSVRQSAEEQMVHAFRAKFPGWPVPSNVRAVVESEHRKSVVRSGNSLPEEAGRSALLTFRDVIGKLPADKKFVITQMRIDESAFQLEGRLRSYEDVDALATSARQAGMEVTPPQARKDSDGLWTFTLHGTRPTKASTEVAKGGGG